MNIEKIRLVTYRYPFLRKLLFPAIAARRFLLSKKSIYQEEVYQHLCEILVEDPILKGDEFQGIFMVDCRSDLFKRLLLSRKYELHLVEWCLKYLDRYRDAIDVGANIGFYTVLFAKNLNERKVLAIEPTVNALERLYKNIQLNHLENKVTVFEGAVLNHERIGEIKMTEGKEEYSTFGEWKHPSVLKKGYVLQKVKITTIDELVGKYSLNPGFLKIDVGGTEHLVLEGCRRTLEIERPHILMELANPLLKANGSSSKEVINTY